MLLVGACTPSSSEETTTTSEPPPSTTSSSTTTTTIPVSVRVLEAFQANLLDEEASFRMDMTMDFEFGGIGFDATGWTLKDASNQHSSFEMEFVGGQTEVLLVGPDLFARSNESVWVRTDAESALADTPSIGVTDENTRKLIEALEYIGTEEVEGETLHRLEVSDQTVIDPNTLGIAPGTINDPEVSMALYADDEGIPQRWTIGITGTSPNPLTGEEADLEVAVLIIYSEWGESRDVVAPDFFWESVDSASMGFTAAVPPGWDTEVEPPVDGLPESYTTFNDTGDEIQVYLSAHDYDPTGGQVLSQQFRADLEEFLAAEFVPATVRVVGSTAVLWQEFQYAEEGSVNFGIHAVMPRSSLSSYEFVWYSFAGDHAADRAELETFISLFAESPTELVTTDQLFPGDCVDFEFDAGAGVAVRRSCTQYHDAEVIVSSIVPVDDFPTSNVDRWVQNFCEEAYTDLSSGVDLTGYDLDFGWVEPFAGSPGVVSCIVVPEADPFKIGSVFDG